MEEYDKIIHEYRKDAVQQFNKHLVYLSSGGLVLSMGFIKDIVDLSKSSWNWIIVLSWCLFAIALLLNLFSYRSTIKSMDLYLNGKKDESDRKDILTESIDKSSIVFLLSGIVLTIIFITKNIF